MYFNSYRVVTGGILQRSFESFERQQRFCVPRGQQVILPRFCSAVGGPVGGSPGVKIVGDGWSTSARISRYDRVHKFQGRFGLICGVRGGRMNQCTRNNLQVYAYL